MNTLFSLSDKQLSDECNRLYKEFRNADNQYDALMRMALMGLRYDRAKADEVYSRVQELKTDLHKHLDEVQRRKQY